MEERKPAKATRRFLPRLSVSRSNEGSGIEAEANNTKKRSKLLTGNFYSPNLERSKFKNFAPDSIINKETSYKFQEKLEKYAEQESKCAPMPLYAKPDSAGLAESPAPKPGQEVWTATCNLTSNQKTCSSSRVTLSTNAQTPILDKQYPEAYWSQKNPTSPNLGQHENSYLKKLKPALLEQTLNPEPLPDQQKPKLKLKETADLLSLKKLKGMASAKNMFINGGLVQCKNQIMLSLQNKEKINKSGVISSPRSPLMEKCQNLESSEALASKKVLSPQLLKEK